MKTPPPVIRDGKIITLTEPKLNLALIATSVIAALLVVGIGGYFIGMKRNSDPITELDRTQPPTLTQDASAEPNQELSSLASTTTTATTGTTTTLAEATQGESIEAAPELKQIQTEQLAINQQTSKDQLRAALSVAIDAAQQAENAQASAILQASQTQDSEQEIQDRLKNLAADPQALQQYNQRVTNRVVLTDVSAGAVSQATSELQAALELAKSANETTNTEATEQLDATQANASDTDSTLQTAQNEDSLDTDLLVEESRKFAKSERTIVVKEGDTLWILARKYYGDGNQYRLLFEANPGVLRSPNHIFPGQVLLAPEPT